MARNSGIIDLSKGQALPTQRTIVVTGIGRGGTSAMATVLYEAGLPRLGRIRRHTQEDWTLGTLLRERRFEAFAERARRRDAVYDVWGFKWPTAYHFPQAMASLRNPRFVVMHRDLVAMSVRNGLDNNLPGDAVAWLRKVHLWQSQQIRFAIESPYPCLCVSYEKLLTNTQQVLDRVSEFVGLSISNEARSKVQPEPLSYRSGLPLSLDDPDSYDYYDDP